MQLCQPDTVNDFPPLRTRAAAEEGGDLADAIGDRFNLRLCRFYLGMAQLLSGDLAAAAAAANPSVQVLQTSESIYQRHPVQQKHINVSSTSASHAEDPRE